MRFKIVLTLVAFMGLICICCKNEDVAVEKNTTNVVDTVYVDSLYKTPIDTVSIN